MMDAPTSSWDLEVSAPTSRSRGSSAEAGGLRRGRSAPRGRAACGHRQSFDLRLARRRARLLAPFSDGAGVGTDSRRGHAVVVGSRRPEFDLGARFFGMLPMSSHVVVKPRKTRRGFADDEPRRRVSAPSTISISTRAGKLVAMENAALFRPLIVASFVLKRDLREVAFFGARQVVVTSASSKTALGLAMLLQGSFRPSVRHRRIAWALSKGRASMPRPAHTETRARSIGRRKP